MVGGEIHTPAQSATHGDSLNLLSELADHLQLASLQSSTARAGERRPVPAEGTEGPVSTSCFSQSPGRERVFPGGDSTTSVASGALLAASLAQRLYRPCPPFTISRRTSAWQIHGKPLTSRALFIGTISSLLRRSPRRIMSAPPSPYVTDAREQMIEHQVRAWDVLDARVLSILRAVPREQFVPAHALRISRLPTPMFHLPCGQHMLRPNVGRTHAAGPRAHRPRTRAGDRRRLQIRHCMSRGFGEARAFPGAV